MEKTLEALILRYKNDMQYDCHSLELRINRSEARVSLQEKGEKVLNLIAKEIELLSSSEEMDYDLFIAFVSLIYGIIEDHKLPEPPYSSKVKYGDQDPKLWIEYCKKNAS